MHLYHRAYGQPSDRPPVVLLHGLFGSSGNWHGIARRLEGQHRVIVPDLRNHGRSPHAEAAGYQAMAEDVRGLLEQVSAGPAALVGHSMGGKVALWLALQHPDRVDRVAALDIAPVTYPPRFGEIIQAMASLDLARLGNRAEADASLAERIRNPTLRAYLLQNLSLRQGRWHWRINLPTLARSLPELLDFPRPSPHQQFTGPALFLYGARSDYVHGRNLAAIRALFPNARLRAVAGAGHWLYSEQPEAVAAALLGFLRP